MPGSPNEVVQQYTKGFFSSSNHRWYSQGKPIKSKKVSSSLNHRWLYSYEKSLKSLSRGLSEITHKGFISKHLKLSATLGFLLLKNEDEPYLSHEHDNASDLKKFQMSISYPPCLKNFENTLIFFSMKVFSLL